MAEKRERISMFRIFDKEHQRMLSGDAEFSSEGGMTDYKMLLDLWGNTIEASNPSLDCCAYHVDTFDDSVDDSGNYVAMIWTGRLDRDGRPIYEHDFIRYQKDDSGIALVRWNQGCFWQITNLLLSGTAMLQDYDSKYLVVVGNAWQSRGIMLLDEVKVRTYLQMFLYIESEGANGS